MILASKLGLKDFYSGINAIVIYAMISGSRLNRLFVTMIISGNWKSIAVALKYEIIDYMSNKITYQKS